MSNNQMTGVNHNDGSTVKSLGVMANTSIESLGVFLPKNELTTRSVLKQCRRRILLPLERMTGIRSRRVTGPDEFSIDLAKGAVADCLSKSQYSSGDIDLIIAANISKQDSVINYNIEPNTAVALRKYFGLDRSLAFDLGNACAGVFTAIYVVDELIRRGDVQRALVVSGEYITHLTDTAQREIQDLHDPRLACLTLGDAGICLLLERGEGFDFIDLYTIPEHAELCVAHTAESHGAIMFTDSVGLAEAAVTDVVPHFRSLVDAGKVREDFDYLIPHQTSSNAIKQASRATNRFFGRKVCHSENMVDNLKYRGNTATTSHWVALNDMIKADSITAGQRVVFSITASGVTVGMAQYQVDSFAVRSNDDQISKKKSTQSTSINEGHHTIIPIGERTRISCAITHQGNSDEECGNAKLAARAAEKTLTVDNRKNLGLLIYSGIYRKAFTSEPALATLVAHEMGLQGSLVGDSDGAQGTLLAFDMMNGPPGVLMACQIAGRLLLSRQGLAIVAASEYNEKPVSGDLYPDIAKIGSAIILEQSSVATGFRSFYFDSYPKYIDSYHSYAQTDTLGPPRLKIVSDDRLYDYYLKSLSTSLTRMLSIEKLSIDDFDIIFPPQISQQFVDQLCEKLRVPSSKMAACEMENAFTSSTAISWEKDHARFSETGSLGLFLSVGPGIEVGCASYVF